MEIKINIPQNDYVQPTEVRQEVVQDICNHIVFWMNKGVSEEGYYEIKLGISYHHGSCFCLIYRSDGTIAGFSTQKERNVKIEFGENYKRIHTVEMEAVFEAIQDAGYYIFGSHCITNNEYTYVFTKKPVLGTRKAERIPFDLFID